MNFLSDAQVAALPAYHWFSGYLVYQGARYVKQSYGWQQKAFKGRDILSFYLA